MKKEYTKPILKEFKIILDDIILVSSKENKDIFDYDEEGIVLFAQEPEAHQQFVMPEEEAYVRKAYQKCPVRAILLENKI